MQHGVRAASPMYQQGAPSRGGMVGTPHQTPSYVAPPQGQSLSYVAAPQGAVGSFTPPVQSNVAVESFPQVFMPTQCHGPPHSLRPRGMSPPPSAAHVGLTPSQHTHSMGRLHDNGRLQAQAESQTLQAHPSRHPPRCVPESSTRPAAVSGSHAPPSGTPESGGYTDTLQQELREQQRQHVSSSRPHVSSSRPANSPVQDSREARAHPKNFIQHPERMRSARGSYGQEVGQLQSQLADERAKNEELQGKVTRYEAELREKKQERRDLKDRERRSTERLEEWERKWTERESRVVEREDQCAKLQQQLFSQQAERDKEIAQRETRLVDRERSLSDRELQLANREAECMRKESHTIEKENLAAQELDDLRRELDEREARIRESEKEFEERKRNLEVDEDRFRARERMHLEACKEAQVLRTTRGPSPRSTGNKENLTKQLEEQREIAHGIKQHGWKQQKPEVIDGYDSLKSAGTGGFPCSPQSPERYKVPGIN